jgi:DNA polymerase-3 subunit delta'
MSWHGLLGQDQVVASFRRALTRERLATSYLFVGPEGVGKRTFALKLAQTLLCERNEPKEMAPCDTCPPCQQVLAMTHPDIEIVSLPEDKKDIPISLLIGDQQKGRRNKEGFCYNLSRKPSRGGRKIGIIDDADKLNEAGANCLLKTLEEPPARSLLILLSNNASSQLPTIRSRCQIIRFENLHQTHLCELIAKTDEIENPDRAETLAGLEEVGLAESILWAEESFWEFRCELLGLLANVPPAVDQLTHIVQNFVEQEKAPIERRKRMTLTFRLAAYFYRTLLRLAVNPGAELEHGDAPYLDETLMRSVTKAEKCFDLHQIQAIDALTRMIDRSLAAEQQTHQNANSSTVIGCWADDLNACFVASV